MPAGNAAAARPTVVEIDRFAEVREAWRCPHLSAGLSGPGEELFHKGTVMRLDGEEHDRRRRAMGLLLRRGGHRHFRDTWLFPSADAAMAEVLARPDPDGLCRVDLLAWARLVNLRLASALIGFDEGTTPGGAQELFALMDTLLRGRPKAFRVVMDQFDAGSAAARAAVEARDRIVARFYEPSLARRAQLVAQVDAGTLDEAELPLDLLTLIARGVDPAWLDPETGRREAIFLLVASINTTSHALVWAVRELAEWRAEHPDADERLADQAFVQRCAEETIRLHPVSFGFPRRATQDVALVGGTHLPDGAIGMIRSGLASMDPAVYGPDADRFDPDREIPPGTYKYGFAFGTGPHMCYGLPVAMGTGGINGSLVYLLQTVLRAGVRPDPHVPVASPGPDRGVFPDVELDGYRVVFPSRQG